MKLPHPFQILRWLAGIAVGASLSCGILAISGYNWRAYAQTQQTTATVTWSAPTENSDGTPLTGLAGYEVQWFGATVDPWLSYNSDAVPADQTSYTVPLICGAYTIQARAVTSDPQTGAIATSDWTAPVTVDTHRACPANLINALFSVK